MSVRSILLAPVALCTWTLSASAQVAPVAGDIAVSEIMFNPGPEVCVTDENGEFFEITNISNKALNLNGIYVEDRNTTSGLPSGLGFQVLPSVATLPTLFPGQRFVFARHTTGSGPIPVVDYAYASAGAAPVDKSQVAVASMFLNNTTVDGLFIATGNFASLGGTIIESVSYNATATPLVSNFGMSVERIDLFQPWAVSGAGNDNNNCAQPLPTALYGTPTGSCTSQQHGTPGAENSTDATPPLWPGNSMYDSSSFPNLGFMTSKGPVSVGAGTARFLLGGLPAAGLGWWMGFAPDIPFELPISPFFPGNPGSFVIDLATSVYLGPTALDGTGAADATISVPNNPLVIGMNFRLQYLSADPSFFIVLSNGVSVLICP